MEKQRQLPALTGIRFFAIFHIFLHHLWATHHYLGGDGGIVEGIFAALSNAPSWFISFIEHGWVSTSFFFLLSGFMLGWLYWDQNHGLTMTKTQFVIRRFARIYPVHLLVLVLLLMFKVPVLISEGESLLFIIGSALATGALLQAWVPQFIPPWNWPAWTISVLVFLYLAMPFLIDYLDKISTKSQFKLLCSMPLIAALPSTVYVALLHNGVEWSSAIELFFANNPLFWLPWFTAGLLLSKRVNISTEPSQSASLVSWGDLALLMAIVIAITPNYEWYVVPFIKFGLLMPIYYVLIRDLATGKGIAARFLSHPLISSLGNIGFSIFIWQSLIITLAFQSIMNNLSYGPHQVSIVIPLMLVVASLSYRFIEKPMVKKIRQHF